MVMFSPLTIRVTIGFERQKKHKTSSYIPEAMVRMLVLSLSQRKLSARVFTDSDYQGTNEPALV